MNGTRPFPATLGLWLCCALLTPAAEPVFDGAKWIWVPPAPGQSTAQYPAGVHYFRGAFVMPDPTRGATELILTADNLYSVYLNGKLAGESAPDPNAWSRPKRFDISRLVVSGRNVLAIEAINTLAGPAGLIASVRHHTNQLAFRSDANWKCQFEALPGWTERDFDDRAWRPVQVVAEHGGAPWGRLSVPGVSEPSDRVIDDARQARRQALESLKAAAREAAASAAQPVAEIAPPADYAWPEAIIFLGDDCSLYRPAATAGTSYDSLSVTMFNLRSSQGYPEHDLPAPVKMGRKLFALRPARPGAEPELLLDAGSGAIGSSSVSYDGRSIYFSMARSGDSFFHIFRLSADGEDLRQLTHGPFHDLDPAELPDGRVVFVSTRIGTFEEYHNPPSRALFVMNASGSAIRPLTHTIIFDNEPEVLADGRILLLRSDNFFDRGKVETLLHAIHPDGADGYTEFGLERGPEYGDRLRAFVCGSPAPLPDGRVAFVSGPGITIGRPGATPRELRHLSVMAGDVAALPDGRLLCTLPGGSSAPGAAANTNRPVPEVTYQRIGILDEKNSSKRLVILHQSRVGGVHSPVFLGPRTPPPRLAEQVDGKALASRSTGFLYCQDARFTRNTTAGWPAVRAIRVLAGKGLTTRSSHSYIVHAGSEVTELGTVPLAPDGSFYVEVPADTALAFQAVDGEGRSELNEMSWIYVRPGETRGCVGCHQPRQTAPPPTAALAQAMRVPPLKLLGQGRPHKFRGNNAAVTGLMELQFERFREVAGINRHSDTVKPTATGSQEVEDLIAQLQTGATDLRISAAQRLAIFRGPGAAPALAELLQHPSRELRVAAAIALSACGTRESIPPLLATLRDADPLAAQAAALALENLSGHGEPFNAFGSRGERWAQAANWRAWFTTHSWDQIVEDLAQRLASTEPYAARRAAVALAHVGDARAVPALTRYLVRERQNNPFPEWRKTHAGDGTRFNALSQVNPRTLQAVTRALGALGAEGAVPLLAETLTRYSEPSTGNLFLAEAAAQALGRIATPGALAALAHAFTGLRDYPLHTQWYGDHEALIACHAAPVHFYIMEALDAAGVTNTGSLTAQLIQSVPTDPDRALLLGIDDYETLAGRLIRRNGAEAAVVETCLALLGDAQATSLPELTQAVSLTHAAWAGKPDPANRAAQILSLVCRDPAFAPRLRAAFERYRARPNDIPRVFDTGIPVVTTLPARHWVCFYLARTLGLLKDREAVETLMVSLSPAQAEAASGRPDPLGPGVLFLHNDLTPCWRAAAAWALGRIGDQRAWPTLLGVVKDFNNALDTRHAAAEALSVLAGETSPSEIQDLASNYPDISVGRVLLSVARKLAPGQAEASGP